MHFLSSRRETGFDPAFRFETSWFLPPVALGLIRACFSLYSFVTLFTIFGYNGTHGSSEDSEHSFSYFTHLTYWGLAFYFLASSLQTCSYWLTGAPPLQRWPRPLQTAHSVLYSTIVVYPWIVTIVFWGLLYPGNHFTTAFATWSNTSQHALNSVYALFEIVVPRTGPLPFLHLIPIVLILALYLALAYLTHATEGFYTYAFLDLDKNSSGSVAGYIIGILVAAIIIFLIIRYLIVLRVWVTETKLGMLGNLRVRGGRQPAALDDDAEKTIGLQSVAAK